MASYLGVDWAGGCWVVAKTGDDHLVTTEPAFFNVWHEHGRDDDVQSILVDVPIGLPEEGTRACDQEAKDRLGARGGSVFQIPRREVVETDRYCEARKMNNNSLRSQSWWLFPRIREVDMFLQEYDDALSKVYESHPELCFRVLADSELSSKDTEDGLKDRRKLLEPGTGLCSRVQELLEERKDAEWHHRISKGRRDDVLDAAVLADTAKRLELGPDESQGNYPVLPADRDVGRDSTLDIHPEIVIPKSRE